MTVAGGGIGVGTRVRLMAAHGIGRVGDEGLVTGFDEAGKFSVQITHRSDCTAVTKLLLGVPSACLATDTTCA